MKNYRLFMISEEEEKEILKNRKEKNKQFWEDYFKQEKKDKEKEIGEPDWTGYD